MTSCCPPPRMRWSGATDAIARCKRVSTGCGRKCRSVRALRWICGVKPKPKAVNKPLQHSIVHGLDKPGVFTTVSKIGVFFYGLFMDMRLLHQQGLDPVDPQIARLDGYDLEIRQRATLVPHPEAGVYGIV